MINTSNIYYGTLAQNHGECVKHYGVLGMRWGVRHDKRYSSVRKARKRELRNYADKQRLKARDTNTKYDLQSVKNKKRAIKQELANRRVAVANSRYPELSKRANRKIQTEGIGKTLAKSAALGSTGALYYDKKMADTGSRAKALLASTKGIPVRLANAAAAATVATPLINNYLLLPTAQLAGVNLPFDVGMMNNMVNSTRTYTKGRPSETIHKAAKGAYKMMDQANRNVLFKGASDLAKASGALKNANPESLQALGKMGLAAAA